MPDEQSHNIDAGAITQRLRALSAGASLDLLLMGDDGIERLLIANQLSKCELTTLRVQLQEG